MAFPPMGGGGKPAFMKPAGRPAPAPAPSAGMPPTSLPPAPRAAKKSFGGGRMKKPRAGGRAFGR